VIGDPIHLLCLAQSFHPHMKAIFLNLLTLSAIVPLQAGLITKPVTYEQNGTKLVGYLAYDDSVTAKGKAPGVLVFHEWWGAE